MQIKDLKRKIYTREVFESWEKHGLRNFKYDNNNQKYEIDKFNFIRKLFFMTK